MRCWFNRKQNIKLLSSIVIIVKTTLIVSIILVIFQKGYRIVITSFFLVNHGKYILGNI